MKIKIFDIYNIKENKFIIRKIHNRYLSKNKIINRERYVPIFLAGYDGDYSVESVVRWKREKKIKTICREIYFNIEDIKKYCIGNEYEEIVKNYIEKKLKE